MTTTVNISAQRKHTALVLVPLTQARQTMGNNAVHCKLIGQRLRASQYSELRNVLVRFHEGQYYLEGSLSSYYMKQLAQTVVQQVNPNASLVNNLDVVYES